MWLLVVSSAAILSSVLVPPARLLPVHPGKVSPARQSSAGCRLGLGIPHCRHGADGEHRKRWRCGDDEIGWDRMGCNAMHSDGMLCAVMG